ncbi:rhamnogalacturonase [Ganoderma leucocontextum]|nr:rhamnogalacturonase [Ganoderma leucocontextum]
MAETIVPQSCVTNSGSTLYVPAGNYRMKTWVDLSHGTKWAFRLDGLITPTTGGNMITIENANHFEFYSANSAGGIQYGYQCRNAGPRLIRVINSNNWSIHDLVLAITPEFHLVYNMAIRGANIGGSDGVDVWGNNYWIHDVEVTNRDECVTVKSPAGHILIERIWCNQSGGSAIGSLSGTAIENVLYRCDTHTQTAVHGVLTIVAGTCTQMAATRRSWIKSNHGSGYVKNAQFQNFISSGTAYGVNIDQYWSSQSAGSGAGVELSNITFSNWDGNVVDDINRPPVQFICADGRSQTDKAVVKCESAYGSASTPPKAVKVTQSAPKLAGYSTPTTMKGDLASAFATNAAIPTP